MDKVYNAVEGKKKLLFIASVGLLFIAVYVVNCLTPHIADDYFFYHNVNLEINDVNDFFTAIKQQYFTGGGRLFATMYTYISVLITKNVFNLVNAVLYVVMTLLVYFICCGFKKCKLWIYILINILIWFFVPDYGQVVFWQSGACNYLWVAVPILANILLFVLYARDQSSVKDSFKNLIFVLPLGFFAGMGGENTSTSMLLVQILYMIYYKRNKIKIPKWAWSSFAASFIGVAVMISAPGNYARMDNETAVVNLSLPFKFCMISYFAAAFFSVLAIIFVLSVFFAKKFGDGGIKRVSVQSTIFIIAAFASAYCMIAAPTSPQRTWFCSILFFIIASGLCLDKVKPINIEEKEGKMLFSLRAAVLLIGVLYFGVMYADTCIATYEIYTQTKEREAYILSEKEKGNLDVTIEVIHHKYPFMANHDALYNLSDITEDKNYFVNDVIAKYYGVNSITGVEVKSLFK